MFIPGSCDIRLLRSNMRIEGSNASYDIELKNQDFETQVERYEEKSKFEEGIDKSSSVNGNVYRWLVSYPMFGFKHANSGIRN